MARKRDDDIDAEIQAHLRMAERDRIERGESPDNAYTAARKEFGNAALIKEKLVKYGAGRLSNGLFKTSVTRRVRCAEPAALQRSPWQ
jgi:hypothetical protein